MATTVSDFIVERLGAWGVRRIFGYPGDGINGLLGALDRARSIQFVQVRHEEMAAFMACAHAKFTGEVGVCLATSGPGAIHLLNGLYDAKLDRQPVVAIVGQQARASLGSAYQQEVDLAALFSDVANAFVQIATEAVQVRHLIDRACRIAIAERTVTCVILPTDVQELDAVPVPPRKHGTVHSGLGVPTSRLCPVDSDLRRAADVLNAGTRVAMLVGSGARGADEELLAVADALGAGIAKALLGKDVLPDDLPYLTGSIGLLGTKPSWDLMEQCDTLLIVGSSFPYSEFLPSEGQVRGVQIDHDRRVLGLRYPTEVNLAGDSRETLRALLPLLKPKTDRSWRARIAKNVADWWAALERRALADANPVNPQRLFWELSPRLPDDCIIAGDSGSSANWYARDLKIRTGMRASLSGTLATMGSAVPYGIAAKFALPERVVIAIAGDGAMQMNGLAELITVAKYWREWRDPRFVVLVLNNGDLNMVTWEQRVLSGNPKFEASQELPNVRYADFARSLGLAGSRVERPDRIAAAWTEALTADRPYVLDAMVDPNTPPLPPHISAAQAGALTKAMWRGDFKTPGLISQMVHQATAGWGARRRGRGGR